MEDLPIYLEASHITSLRWPYILEVQMPCFEIAGDNAPQEEVSQADGWWGGVNKGLANALLFPPLLCKILPFNKAPKHC